MKKNESEKCIALIGDPHLPGRNFALKQKVIADINSWDEVDLVVCLGDLCENRGGADEFALAARFFAELHAPFITLLGNHDTWYADAGFYQGGEIEGREKIARFHRAFPGQKLSHSSEFAGLRLIFLNLDGFTCPYYSGASSEQLEWFDLELQKHPQQTTVVFYHAPLWSDELVKMFPHAVNYLAQPAEAFARVVAKHPQIRLWVSGHVHFGMIKELIMNPFNLFQGRVMNILNCDLDGFSVLNRSIKPEFHDRVWTRQLFVSPTGYRCTVFDHNLGVALPELAMEGTFVGK